MDRSFLALFSRNNENGANIKISSSIEAGSRRYEGNIGYEGKEIMEYVKEQQKFDREERAAWTNIRMTELQTEAEEKRRADEIKVQMAKIEAEKELTLREMELKAQDQASASLAATLPPRNKDAKSPKLPSFIDEKDELDSYLLRFERYAEMLVGRRTHGLLS